MNLRIVEDTDDLLLLELAGSLDLEGVREIETAFLAHVTFAKRPVILDFSQVTFLASFGMRMLFEAIKATREAARHPQAAADGGAGPRTRRRKFSCSYLIRWSRCPFEAALVQRNR
jgi:STAS domain